MSWSLPSILLVWSLVGPLWGLALMDWLERWAFYQERCHTLRWIPLFVSGPLVWLAALNRACRSDLIRYWQRQAARERIQEIRESCGKGKLGDVTFKDGRLVERRMAAFHPRLLDKPKPYFWFMHPNGNAKLEVGDRALDETVSEFECTRDTIINRLRSSMAARNERETERWRLGLQLLNLQRTGYYQHLQENGQYVWKESGKGLGWCRTCNLKLRHCECREIEIITGCVDHAKQME